MHAGEAELQGQHQAALVHALYCRVWGCFQCKEAVEICL